MKAIDSTLGSWAGPIPSGLYVVCVWGLLAGFSIGCVPMAGGWDLEALRAEVPGVESGAPHRIGDLTPYPALLGDSLALVVCRFEADAVIQIEVAGDEWPEAWSQRALSALDFDAIELELAAVGAAEPNGKGPRIHLQSIAGPDESGPIGLGDTLTECDVSERLSSDVTTSEQRAVTGVLRDVRIRMRRRIRKQTGRVFEASEAEWAVAFLHEVAHGLGFAGHVSGGESVLRRDQSGLRGIGLRVAAGQSVSTPNIDALYRIPAGHVLGRASLTREGATLVEEVLRLVQERAARVGPPVGPRSTAGDREARLVWRWPGGLAISLRFPDWSGELRRQEPVSVEASAATRLLLEHRRQSRAD